MTMLLPDDKTTVYIRIKCGPTYLCGSRGSSVSVVSDYHLLKILMKYCRKVILLRMISIPHFLIPYLRPFHSGRRSDSRVVEKVAPVNVRP
jgi:hypothetical protein